LLQSALVFVYKRLKIGYCGWAQQTRWYQELTAIALCLFCISVSFPSYELFIEPNEIVTRNWEVLQTQSDAPLTPHYYPPEDHAGQLACRLFLPALAHILHLPIKGFIFLLPLVGFLFFTLLQKIAKRAGLGIWEGLLASLSLAAVYVGKSFFVDVLGYFDGYVFLLLLAAIYVRHTWVAYLAYFCCLFIDERAYLAVPLVAVARYWLYATQLNTWAFWKVALPTAVVLLLGLVTRYLLHIQFGLISGTMSENLGWQTVRSNFQISALGLLTGLDFWTFGAFLPAFYFWQKDQRLLALGFIIYLATAFLAMLIVLDLSRCTAYLYPAVLASIFCIARFEKPKFGEKILLFFTVTSLLFPPLFVIGDYVLWMGPIIPKLIRVIANLGFGIHI